MKWSKEHKTLFENAWYKTARSKKRKLKICFTGTGDSFYYFLVNFPNGKTFNSLWEELRYDTEEDCLKGLLTFLEALENGVFPMYL